MPDYTVRKVEVWRVVDDKGREVGQYDDEYGHEYPLDFDTEQDALAWVTSECSPGLHGPLTKVETERRQLLDNVYGQCMLMNLKASTPLASFGQQESIPANGGKSIQFFRYQGAQ
jgi:hypothetical protein